MRALLLAGVAAVCLGGQAVAQSTCSTIGSLPSVALGANPADTTAATDQTVASLAQGSTNATQAMMSTPYGSTAVNAANQLGVNPNSIAAIGQAESGFQNVPTANGSSSASGPWQITAPTFIATSNQYGLGYTAADQTNPNAQAVESSYIVRDYASAVQQATGSPVTTAQAYGAYVFGPSAGSQMATADPSTPLSNLISAKALSNNNMSGWTVGQFYSTMSQRLGPAATQNVLTTA